MSARYFDQTIYNNYVFPQNIGVSEVAIEIKGFIEEFKPFIPLIQGLRNPGMRNRHWETVWKLAINLCLISLFLSMIFIIIIPQYTTLINVSWIRLMDMSVYKNEWLKSKFCLKQLSAELGFPIKPKASLTFSKCLEMKLQDHINVIAKVAEVAGKEYSIEQVSIESQSVKLSQCYRPKYEFEAETIFPMQYIFYSTFIFVLHISIFYSSDFFVSF